VRIAVFSLLSICTLTIRSWAEGAESTAVLQPKVAHYSYDAIPKDPLASAFFSATIPGSGQIYNKEYLRGVLTGVGFWGGLLTAEYYLYKWIRINTDTVHLCESDNNGNPTGFYRDVYVMRSADKQIGLPTAEKAILISAVVIGAGSYLFGIYDSYRGAHRYNNKLFADAAVKPDLYCSIGSQRNELGLRLRF
jgi:hypothetical protein